MEVQTKYMNNFEENITVNAYSGYKANEKPLDFTLEGIKVKIVKVTERWAEPDRDCFRVQGDDGRIYTLCWDRERNIWSLIEKNRPL